jgi:flagellar protein FliO/FliZ
MLDGLFGTELPFAAKFILAFVIVLGLILLLLWAVRRFGSGGLDGVRGRQHRLSVLEWARVDNRRSLCLIRRDNVEHLLIVGGPTDVVIEANIVRAATAPRDVGIARPAPLEPLPRAIPLPDNGNGSWPLQPDTVTAPPPLPARSAPRVDAKFEPKVEPVADEPLAWPPLQPQAETPPPSPAPGRPPQRDTLAALADELSARPTPPPPLPPRSRPPGGPRMLEPRGDRTESRPEPRPEPRTPAPSAAAPADADAAAAAAADQSLAEMAHRLEAALRKPSAPAEARTPAPPRPAPAAPAPAPAAEQQAAASEPASPAPPPPRSARPQGEPKQPPRNAPAKPPQGATLYDNLEQEMASLLGRPTNKN